MNDIYLQSLHGTTGQAHTMHATTVLAVLRDNIVAMASDGQVTLGNTVVKHSAKKIRKIQEHNVLVGFAGSTADAFSLFERFEAKLSEYKTDLRRAAVELAKEWRTDKVLRRLEAMLVVANKDTMLMVSGLGDVIEPEHDILAIGSGGSFAYAAAKGLYDNTQLDAETIVQKSMEIAADICIYTNNSITLEVIK